MMQDCFRLLSNRLQGSEKLVLRLALLESLGFHPLQKKKSFLIKKKKKKDKEKDVTT